MTRFKINEGMRLKLTEQELKLTEQELKLTEQELKLTEQELKLTEQDMVIREMGRRLTYYENSNSPPSANNLPTQKKKTERRTDPKKDMQCSNTGRKKGHSGVSHSRKSYETIIYKEDKCKECGNTDLTYDKAYQKQITDITFVLETKTHVSYKSTYTCGCVMDSTPKWLRRNTSVGPNMTSLGVLAWYNASSLKSIKNIFAFFGLKVCKRTVENMLTSASASMYTPCGKINRELKDTKFAKFDETPIIIYDHRGYVWVCVGDNATSIRSITSYF